MKHHGAISIHCLGVFLAIAGSLVLTDVVAEDQPPGDTGTQSSSYSYSNDWAIVSAPPPPGPYQSVNVDPRIPGQEDLRIPFGSGLDTPRAQSEELPGDFMGAPPSAGTPARPMAPGAYTGNEPSGDKSPPGTTDRKAITRAGPHRSRIIRVHMVTRPQAIRVNGYAPSPWYNSPGQRSEDEVPPPPLYNGRIVPPSPDQLYRRGSGAQ